MQQEENNIQEQESPELAAFKKQWIGKSVRVTDDHHPHFNAIGDVIDVERTLAGWGMKIKCTQNDSIHYGSEFYIFKGKQIEIL